MSAEEVEVSQKKLTIHNQCHGCIHRRSIPGDAHTRCAAPWETGDAIPKGHRVGIQGGWWRFPWNFDPTWHTDWCARRKSEHAR